MPAVEEVTTEVAAPAEEEAAPAATSDTLVEDAEWGREYSKWFEGDESAWEALTEEASDAENLVESSETAEVEDSVEALEAWSEDASGEELVADVEAETTADVEASEEIASEEIATEEELAAAAPVVESSDAVVESGDAVVESSDADSDVAEFATDEVLDALIEQWNKEVTALVEPSEAIEANVEERVAENYDADETLETDATEAEGAETEAASDVTEPSSEAAELPWTDEESIPADNTDGAKAVAVRTLELPGCKLTVASDSECEIDDLQMLNLLWAAIHQLEAEMD